ncbi:hypothetical protein [Hydrogenophaga sp.]|uniref:hypothetical protein n=1 Tax=Hydrogenophaga sp. TaxID=1904254 RepID=UPI002ABBB10B|nr:hypothetical protein [Hydrogenophaga sp.]MDZ4397972.1 hypothetical protein [Hydrogenophaga sp.]
MAETTETLPPLAEVAHAQSAALLDVLTLLHYAIEEANEYEFNGEKGLQGVAGMTDRNSRLLGLLAMSRDRVGDVIEKFDPYI